VAEDVGEGAHVAAREKVFTGEAVSEGVGVAGAGGACAVFETAQDFAHGLGGDDFAGATVAEFDPQVIGGCGGTNGEPALQGGLGGVGEEEPAGFLAFFDDEGGFGVQVDVDEAQADEAADAAAGVGEEGDQGVVADLVGFVAEGGAQEEAEIVAADALGLAALGLAAFDAPGGVGGDELFFVQEAEEAAGGADVAGDAGLGEAACGGGEVGALEREGVGRGSPPKRGPGTRRAAGADAAGAWSAWRRRRWWAAVEAEGRSSRTSRSRRRCSR
jgi:hypothetical protein